MEHRCSIRIGSALDAIVNCRRVGVVHAKVKDVGRGGMFIETGSIALRLNTPVEVAVRVSENGVNRLVRLRALVVWTGRRGAGLMLRSFDDAIYGALRKVVSGDRDSIGSSSAPSDGIAQRSIRKSGFSQRSRRRFA